MPERYIEKDKMELDTPCLALDIATFEHNLTTMRDAVLAAGKKLRPHTKTHKCSELTRRQIAAGGTVGVCVAKVSEAAALIDAGINNVLITSPVVTPQKIAILMQCAVRTPDIMVVIDNPENAVALNAAAAGHKLILKVLVDVNPSMGRTGVNYADALPLGGLIAGLPSLKLRGIQCYAGMVQHIHAFDQRREASLKVMQQAAEVFRQFKTAGLGAEIFTGTGTGTFDVDTEIPEMTDFQVGSYCVMDAEYSNLSGKNNPEKFDQFKPALTILSSVISVNQQEFVTVDAGLKSLYFTPHAPPMIIHRHGMWNYEWFGDEHGRIYPPPGTAKPKLGEIIEMSAPHCDPTINLYDYIWVTENGKVIDRWPIDLRGKAQ
ncbi:MAG: DSD1 family PLP-dependent enzyme [Victivallaceae bacterium]